MSVAVRRHRALLLGPAALILAASLGVAEIPVPIAPVGGAVAQPTQIDEPSPGAPGPGSGTGAGGPGAPSSSIVQTGRRAGDVAVSCSSGPRGGVPARVVYHGSRAEKVVALTFDDGWGGGNLERILLMLRNAHVNATFFPVGQAIHHDLATWRKVAAAGFPIADHTFDHGDLAGLCYAAQLAELRRARTVIERSLGVSPLAVMRPPGGNYDDATRVAAASAGERDVVLWDIDTRDWSGASWRAIAGAAVAGQNGSIVVMHTDLPNTARALPTIIKAYRNRGFRFVTIGQLLGMPGAVPFP